MISFPNAKINLGLNIIEKRPDGYHTIETVFYPIALSDALEFIVSEENKTSFQQSGIEVDTPFESNLIFKAYQLLKTDFSLPELSVYLQKNIPFGAGLGGGSSDAAFMLKMLNENFQLGLNIIQLESYAAQLGSDCPVFIRNKPVFATGRGEIFEAINLSLKGHYIALIKPSVFVSTKDAYNGCKPQKPIISLKEIIQKPIEEWKNLLFNDFETTVFPQFPIIKEVKEKLYQSGAIYASMSGSGSSVFGIFREKTHLKNAFQNCFVWEGRLV
jgi:4-diphosphocytidyl-2-C-methyl-D-erythritol kinase